MLNALYFVEWWCQTQIMCQEMSPRSRLFVLWNHGLYVLLTFENRVPLMRKVASVVWHTSYTLMNSFNNINGKDVQIKNVVNNVDMSSLRAPWQNGPAVFLMQTIISKDLPLSSDWFSSSNCIIYCKNVNKCVLTWNSARNLILVPIQMGKKCDIVKALACVNQSMNPTLV